MTDQPLDSSDSSQPPGFADVVAEIEAETERRRTSGQYPRELLERLDAEFDRFAPLSFRRTGIDGAIRAVESAAFIDVEAPIESSRRSATALKKAVKKSTAWYHLHVARQVTAMGIQITRPLRMLSEMVQELSHRVSELERATGQASPEHMAAIASLHQEALSEEVAEAVAGLFSHGQGRTAVIADAGEAVVLGLIDRGIDAYGVSPQGGGGLTLEIRAEQPLTHLRSLESDVLAGAVLVAMSDASADQSRVELCQLIVDRVAPGGRVVIVAPDPEMWAASVGPVVADLMPSRPFHTETWFELLRRFGGRAPGLEATVDAQRVIVASAS